MTKKTTITIAQAIDLLNQELRWCVANPEKAPNADYREGFMEGLEQARRIIKAVENPFPIQTTSSRTLILIRDDEV